MTVFWIWTGSSKTQDNVQRRAQWWSMEFLDYMNQYQLLKRDPVP